MTWRHPHILITEVQAAEARRIQNRVQGSNGACAQHRFMTVNRSAALLLNSVCTAGTTLMHCNRRQNAVASCPPHIDTGLPADKMQDLMARLCTARTGGKRRAVLRARETILPAPPGQAADAELSLGPGIHHKHSRVVASSSCSGLILVVLLKRHPWSGPSIRFSFNFYNCLQLFIGSLAYYARISERKSITLHMVNKRHSGKHTESCTLLSLLQRPPA